MARYDLIARFTSTDPRDGGSFTDRVIGRNEDGILLATLAARLTQTAKDGRDAYHAGPAGRSFEDRQAARLAHQKRMLPWADVSLAGDDVSFHVAAVPDVPVIDLAGFDPERPL